MYLQGVKVTKSISFGLVNFVSEWKRKYRGIKAE